MSPSRGPDPLDLALNRCVRSKLHLLEVQRILVKALNEDREADKAALALGITPPAVTLERELHAARQMHRGDAFWEREPAEPTPLRATS